MIPHDRRPWYEPYHRLVKLLSELSAHLLVVAATLSGIKLLELLVHRFWGTDYLFFGWLTLKYVFDDTDILILVGFLIWGLYSVIGAYLRKP